MKKYFLFILLFTILGTAQISFGLSTEQIGPNSSRGFPAFSQPNWPKGVYEITNLESRVYSIDTNGNTNYYFEATIEEINEIINLFSKVTMRDHIVRISGESGVRKTILSDMEIQYNVRFQVVTGMVLFSIRQEQREDLPLEPCLTILTEGDNSVIEKLKWPENIIIENFVPEISIKSNRQKPERDYYYGLLEFADGSPPVEFVSGLDSRVTLWQQDKEDGINIGDVNNKGYFSVLLSEEELVNLKKGSTWLTVTISNFLTEAQKTDQRFPVDMLTQDKEKAKPVKVDKIEYYYGRILFEDGSPAVLDSELWSGAEIWIDFPYAGMTHIDPEGYFKVFFTKEQYEKAKAGNERNNIVVPDSQKTNISRGMYVFPITELSQDKSKAGVVKIPRPEPPKIELAKAESKIGRPIPGFDGISFKEFQKELINDKSLLVCFWDMEQRPSRKYLQELQEQKDELQKKNITVLIVHTGIKTEEEVGQWLEENRISLASGIVKGDSYNTLLAWGARGLPWLILVNKEHIIIAEGFGLDGMNEKIKEIENAKQ